MDDSIEIEDKNKFLNGNDIKENIDKKQDEVVIKKDTVVKEINKNNNEIFNNQKSQIQHNNQNFIAGARNIADSAKEKNIEIDVAKDSANNIVRDNSKFDKSKNFNKKANNEACKCVMF